MNYVIRKGISFREAEYQGFWDILTTRFYFDQIKILISFHLYLEW